MSCGCGGNCECSTELSQFNQVRYWMSAINQPTPNTPAVPDLDTIKLRIALIEEELNELKEACGMEAKHSSNGISITSDWSEPILEKVNLVEVMDALTDIMYVTLGAGVTFGMDLDKSFEEVQRSNNTKIIDGFAHPETGKWMKGPSYDPPKLEPILNDMIENPMD